VSLHGVAKANWDTQEHENQHEINSQQKTVILEKEICSFNPIFQ
jgi:hypothetical protein